MRSISLLVLSAVAALAQTPNGTLQNGTMSWSSNGVGITMVWRTAVEPAPQASAVRISGGYGQDTVLHRYLVDQTNLKYFGYDLAIAAGPNPGHFTITISPLTIKPADFNMGKTGIDPSTLLPVALPAYPPPQDVQEGDTVALDLLASPDGNTKVVDYFSISGHGAGPAIRALAATTAAAPAVASTGVPKDFTLDDGAPHFSLEGSKITVNGQAVSTAGVTSKPGATVWVAVPYHGRYILSLLPHEGFQKAGTVRGNTISFEAEGQKYEISAGTAGGVWNLYVLHDPLYQSKPDGITLGTDRMENLLPKQ